MKTCQREFTDAGPMANLHAGILLNSCESSRLNLLAQRYINEPHEGHITGGLKLSRLHFGHRSSPQCSEI